MRQRHSGKRFKLSVSVYMGLALRDWHLLSVETADLGIWSRESVVVNVEVGELRDFNSWLTAHAADISRPRLLSNQPCVVLEVLTQLLRSIRFLDL